MKLYHIRTLENLERYKNTWNSILEKNKNNNPFIEFLWVEKWWRYLGENHGIEIIVVEDSDKVIAFFPFKLSKVFNITMVEFIGYGDANYMDIIVSDADRERAIQFVVDELILTMPKCLFSLKGLLSSSPTTNMLSLYLERKKLDFAKFSIVAPYINMQSVELEPYINKRRKLHGLDRKEKKLHSLGVIRVAPIDLSKIEEVFSLHDKQWKHKIDTSYFKNNEHKKLHASLLRTKQVSMQAIVEGLFLGNQMIAYSYGLLCRGRYHRYMTGYDEDYGLFGPGTILDKELIFNSKDKAIQLFDLSPGYESYKFNWNTGVDYSNNFLFSSTDWKTKMLLQFYKGKEQLNFILKKNSKLVVSLVEFIGNKSSFIKNAGLRDWIKASKNLVSKIYSQKSINVYQQSYGQSEVANYRLTNYQETKNCHHDIKKINKRYFNGFFPYTDPSVSTFWVHQEAIRAEEVGYLEQLPKDSAFIADWQIHKLSNFCSYLREDQNVKEIFLYTTKSDHIIEKHLEQLGFEHKNRIKKRSVFSKSKTFVLPPPVKK